MKRNELNIKWIEALRSGKYKQANGYLQTKDGYCCLGVGRVAVLGGKCRDEETELDYTENSQLGMTSAPWEDDNGNWFEADVTVCINMNDVYHRPFTFIADVIEYAVDHEVTVGQALDAIESAENA